MLYWLAEYLTRYHSAFNVFSYLTFRGILSVLTALILSFVLGPMTIRRLSFLHVGQSVRSDGPKAHLAKAGTPTMGGALILGVIIIATLLWGNLANRYVWILIGVTVGFGLIGFADDYRKVALKNSEGLRPAVKYLLQSIVGLAVAVALFTGHQYPAEIEYIVPLLKHVAVNFSGFFILITYFVVVGMSNAVNLTDGLDGLAIMPAVLVAGALAIFGYLSGNFVFARYLTIPYLPGAGEIVIFCGALVGAGLGFLWFNAYPAQVFMGDVGALALGAALGTLGVIVREEIVLFIMSGVFVMETASVILQVGSYKLTGRRLFRMAPIHHHFELKGWPEPRVIVRFWIITVILVLIGLSALKVR